MSRRTISGSRWRALAVAAGAVLAASLVTTPVAPSVGAAATTTAVTLVNAYGNVFDVYFDGALVTGASGLAEGSMTTGRSSGDVTVAVYPHVSSPPASPTGRVDQLQQQTVTVPVVDSASIVIGRSPAGGVGLPFVSVYTNDVSTPPAGAGRFVLRHTADVAAMDYQIIQTATTHWTFIGQGVLARGGEVSVDVPVPATCAGCEHPQQRTQLIVTAKAVGATYAAPPLVWESSPLVGIGETVIAYVDGPQPRAVTVPNPPACSDPGTIPPPGAANVTEATGDVDGDGGPDEVFAWSETVGPNTVWSLGVVPAHGFGATTALTEPGIGPVSLLGVADVNVDHIDEAVLSVGNASGFDQVQFWGYRGCAFQPAVVSGTSAPATFAIGAQGDVHNGITCIYTSDSKDLFQRQIAPTAAGLEATQTDFSWNDLTLEQLGIPVVYSTSSADTVLLEWSSTLSCGVPPTRLVLTQPASPGTPTAAPISVTPRFTG